ncbi:MAG: hypothetical protein K9H48_21695 [Melioribacteraceae bacterium]|nr:hypothetical protein [Candidatus Omnitrophota bacterium]MCF8357064.1 hypothetical protein [Melioribacteraceae bacterium]
MAKICPLISKADGLHDCLGDRCALWIDISLGGGQSNKKFIGCTLAINAQKKLYEEKDSIDYSAIRY